MASPFPVPGCGGAIALDPTKFEMLMRAKEFGASHTSAFPAETHVATLLTTITSSVEVLERSSAAQAAGSDVVRAGTINRQATKRRCWLLGEFSWTNLETVQRAAKVIAQSC